MCIWTGISGANKNLFCRHLDCKTLRALAADAASLGSWFLTLGSNPPDLSHFPLQSFFLSLIKIGHEGVFGKVAQGLW